MSLLLVPLQVGLFHFWRLKQIPNFLAAAPIWILSVAGVLCYFDSDWARTMSLGLEVPKPVLAQLQRVRQVRCTAGQGGCLSALARQPLLHRRRHHHHPFLLNPLGVPTWGFFSIARPCPLERCPLFFWGGGGVCLGGWPPLLSLPRCWLPRLVIFPGICSLLLADPQPRAGAFQPGGTSTARRLAAAVPRPCTAARGEDGAGPAAAE